jgi:C4-dicarboxylate transporter DctM subunit
MEELSVMLLTLPIFFPIVSDLGFDPVWFGVLVVISVQIGLISPPVGMNNFVIKSLVEDILLNEIYRGALPFTLALILLMGLVLVMPELATWLPGKMR